MQVSEAAQTLPHLPQFSLLEAVLTQDPPHIVVPPEHDAESLFPPSVPGNVADWELQPTTRAQTARNGRRRTRTDRQLGNE